MFIIPFIGTAPRDWGKVMTFTRKNYDLQVLLRPIKSEFMTCIMTCKMGMIGQQNSALTADDRDLRACDKQAAVIIQRCSPTAAQKPAAAEGNTISVRRYIRVHQSSQSVTEDRQSWGCGRIIYPYYTAQSPTATRKKLTNPLQWCSCVSCCCAGSRSVRFSSNYACLLSAFAFLCT